MIALKVMIQKFFTKRIVNVFLMGVVLVFRIVGPERIVEGEILLFHDLSTLSARIGGVGGIGYQ